MGPPREGDDEQIVSQESLFKSAQSGVLPLRIHFSLLLSTSCCPIPPAPTHLSECLSPQTAQQTGHFTESLSIFSGLMRLNRAERCPCSLLTFSSHPLWGTQSRDIGIPKTLVKQSQDLPSWNPGTLWPLIFFWAWRHSQIQGSSGWEGGTGGTGCCGVVNDVCVGVMKRDQGVQLCILWPSPS